MNHMVHSNGLNAQTGSDEPPAGGVPFTVNPSGRIRRIEERQTHSCFWEFYDEIRNSRRFSILGNPWMFG